jgi:hypothetical protein
MVVGPGDDFCIVNDALRRWCSFYIPYETLAAASGDAMTNTASRHGFVQVPHQRIERFLSIVAQFDETIQRDRAEFKSAGAQKSAGQKLVRGASPRQRPRNLSGSRTHSIDRLISILTQVSSSPLSRRPVFRSPRRVQLCCSSRGGRSGQSWQLCRSGQMPLRMSGRR